MKTPRQLLEESKEIRRRCLGANECPDVVAVENILNEVGNGFDEIRRKYAALEKTHEAQTQLLIRTTLSFDDGTKVTKMSIDKLRDDVKLETDNLHKRINDGGKENVSRLWKVLALVITIGLSVATYANNIESQADAASIEIKALKSEAMDHRESIRAVRLDITTIRESIIRQESVNARILDGIKVLKGVQ